MADLILEWLQWQMGCTYLPDVATLEEWRDIYRYLNSAPIIVPDE